MTVINDYGLEAFVSGPFDCADVRSEDVRPKIYAMITDVTSNLASNAKTVAQLTGVKPMNNKPAFDGDSFGCVAVIVGVVMSYIVIKILLSYFAWL